MRSQVLRLAWQELRRQGQRIEPRILAATAILAVLIGLLVAAVPPDAPAPDRDLYTVDGDPASVLTQAARESPRFVVVDEAGQAFEAHEADLRIIGDEIHQRRDDARGEAAFDVLLTAIRQWQERQLTKEDDVAAAFPVAVDLVLRDRQAPVLDDTAPEEPEPTATTGPNPGPAPEADPVQAAAPDPDKASVSPALRPAQVEPPFPVRSLLLTFAYVLPGSLIVQAYAGGLQGDRVRQRGVLLLSSPVSPAGVVFGRALPTAALLFVLAVVVSIFLGTGWWGFVASLSFLAFLLALATYLSFSAQSARELALLLVAGTTILNVFLFLPAMFPSIAPVAFLSPIHVIATSIRNQEMTLGRLLYSMGPIALATVGLTATSIGFARAEVWFSVHRAGERLTQALRAVTPRWWHALATGALVIPFVFTAQLTAFMLTAVLGLQAAFLLWLPFSVVLEELAKGLAVWAGVGHRLKPWVRGVLVGTGFFVGEKAYLVLTLVGFESLPFGDEVLALLGTGPGILWFAVPLAIHVGTAVLQSVGAARSRQAAGGMLALAIVLHLLYDQLVLRVAMP